MPTAQVSIPRLRNEGGLAVPDSPRGLGLFPLVLAPSAPSLHVVALPREGDPPSASGSLDVPALTSGIRPLDGFILETRRPLPRASGSTELGTCSPRPRQVLPVGTTPPRRTSEKRRGTPSEDAASLLTTASPLVERLRPSLGLSKPDHEGRVAVPEVVDIRALTRTLVASTPRVRRVSAGTVARPPLHTVPDADDIIPNGRLDVGREAPMSRY